MAATASILRPLSDGKTDTDSVMRNPPGVTVVIPCYNYAHFLPKAIESALSQDYPNKEIIVVDDGSPDNTREVALSYGDRVRHVHQQNAGLSAARNKGIAEARHEFIAFLDADDWWTPGWLKAAMETFARLPEDYAVVACQWNFITPDGRRDGPKLLDQHWPREVTVEQMLIRSRFQPSGVVARKTVLQACGGFDTTLRSTEDRDMWIRIAARHRIYCLKEPYAGVLSHPGSMSRNAARMKVNMQSVLGKARAHDVLKGGRPWVWMQAQSFLLYQTAWMFRDSGDHRGAIRDLLHSMMRWPFFLNPHAHDENFFFRLRTLRQFLAEAVRGSFSPATVHPRHSRNVISGTTVVIPAYNYAHFLPDAIDSVLSQQVTPLEVIVVDDGSTDNTREVVARYGDRVRYIHQPNAGLSAARNTGIQAASHAWIALLDADDEFMPDMLRTLAGRAASLPAEYGLLACASLRMDRDKRPIKTKQLQQRADGDVTPRAIVLHNQFVADAVLFRRDIAIRAGGFDTTLRSSEDRDMWIRMGRLCRIYKIAEPLVRVRMHGNSMSRNAARMRDNMLKVLARSRAAGVVHRWHLPFWAKAHSFLHYQTAWMFRDAGDYRNATAHLLRSLLLYPLFLNPHRLNENYLFRVRSLVQFVREWRHGQGQKSP